jgi:DNA-directed RNA polymerase specialized sigma24 family protein
VTFDELIEKGARAIAKAMAGLCKKVGLTEQDITQDVAKKAAKKPPTGGTDGEIVNWAKLAALSTIVDAYRKTKKTIPTDDPYKGREPITETIDDGLTDEEAIRFVEAIVKRAHGVGYKNTRLLRTVLLIQLADPFAKAKEIARIAGVSAANVFAIRYYARGVGALLLEQEGEKWEIHARR